VPRNHSGEIGGRWPTTPPATGVAQRRAGVARLAAARRPHPRVRLPRRVLPRALVALPVALLLCATVAADLTFRDRNAGGPHNDTSAAIETVGGTTGGNPPAYAGYCPNGLVTRAALAGFFARIADRPHHTPGLPPRSARWTAANARSRRQTSRTKSGCGALWCVPHRSGARTGSTARRRGRSPRSGTGCRRSLATQQQYSCDRYRLPGSPLPG